MFIDTATSEDGEANEVAADVEIEVVNESCQPIERMEVSTQGDQSVTSDGENSHLEEADEEDILSSDEELDISDGRGEDDVSIDLLSSSEEEDASIDSVVCS